MRTEPTFRIAIVHDWLIGGGAELVVEQLHKLYPEAPIYTSYCTKEWRQRLDGKVKTGVLQYWPLSRLRKFLPILRIWWFTRLDLTGYDVVVSSSGAEAKGIRRLSPNTLHINYCHAPTHYYWSRYNDYVAQPGFGAFNWLARFGLRLLVEPLRRWDYRAAQRPDYIIANSNYTKSEILKYYDRASIVIHPPVYTDRFHPTSPNQRRSGFVISGRQTPYKRFDIAIAACSRLNLPLTVIGSGPDQRRLRKLAGPSVTFLGHVSDVVVATQFATAKALIFPGVDDFGITPVEAMAAGAPIIAYQGGGALDYVAPGKTGVFFRELSAEALCSALQTFSTKRFNSTTIAQAAQRFSAAQFAHRMRFVLKKVITEQPTKPPVRT